MSHFLAFFEGYTGSIVIFKTHLTWHVIFQNHNIIRDEVKSYREKPILRGPLGIGNAFPHLHSKAVCIGLRVQLAQ